MDLEKMRNIVILKDLPSNIVEEAIVVLKENKNIKKLEYIDYKKDTKFTSKKTEKNYIIKEAEMLVSNYISELETKKEKIPKNFKKKYDKLKCLSIFLGFLLILSFFIK